MSAASDFWSVVGANSLTAEQNLLAMLAWYTDLAKIHGLVPSAPLVVTATSRTAGDIAQTIDDAAGVVTVTRL